MTLAKPKREENRELLDTYHKKRCLVKKCRSTPCDPAHVISKGAGGPDEAWNILPLCRACHGAQHQMGLVRFIAKYPEIKHHLESVGWEINYDGKIWHPDLKR